MTSSFYQEKETNNIMASEYLYPHGSDCLSIIVPKDNKLESFLEKFLHDETIQSIFIIFFLFVLVRIILERSSMHKWFSDFFITLGIFLPQNFIKNISSNTVLIWLMGLLPFSVITTCLLSSIIYKTLVEKLFSPDMNTLDELIQSNLTLLLTNTDTLVESWGSNLK